MSTAWIARLGFAVRSQVTDIGTATRLFARLLLLLGAALRRPVLLRDQIHFLGNHSLALIGVSGLFVGFVLGLQGYYTLRIYGATEALGLLLALSLVRELGPVITALLFAGRAGTSLTAEIGLMKAGEQLSAMEMMAVDPVRRVLAPRFWAGVIVMPLLAGIFSAVGVIGGWVVGVLMLGLDGGAFWSQMQGGVDVWADVGNGVIKSVVFGFAVTFVALLQGFSAHPTPEGVSRATTRTVVVASLAVLAVAMFFASFPLPTSTAVMQILPPNQMRAQISALFLLVSNLIGLGLGTTAVALLTDHLFKDPLQVGNSISLLNVGASALTIALLFAGCRHYRASLVREGRD